GKPHGGVVLQHGSDLVDYVDRIVGSTIGGDENTRCLPIARAVLNTRASVGNVVERDVNMIGRTGANPWLVVLVGANVMVDHRPDARKRIDRTGVVRIL